MRLRLKITLLLVAVIAASVVTNYVIQRLAVMPSFRSLEHEAAVEDWHRSANGIERDLEALSQLCYDWAAWDDTYAYVQDQFPEFYDGNLDNPDWFVDQSIDFLYVCQPDGTVYWSHVTELEEGVPTQPAWLPRDKLPEGHPLMQVEADKESMVDGLMRTELGFVLLSAHPILTSQYEGPMAGVLIFGRHISDERVEELQSQTGVVFTLLDPESEGLTAEDRSGIAAATEAGEPVEQVLDSDRLTVRGLVNDLEGRPAMLIQTVGDRTISQHGLGSLNFATWSLIVAGLLTLVTLLVVHRRMVIEPLDALTEHATRVGEQGRAVGKLGLTRSDEIGTLARSFDRMLEQLDDFRGQTARMSRQAGMAEVAAGVLHNVGNAMTNVCVLAETMGNKLAKSRGSNLAKVSGLLETHKDDLPGFFAPGQQGTKLPAYVAELAGQLRAENESLRHDVTELHEGLQHVKVIVASHQGMASGSNFEEVAGLADVVAGSLPLVEASFKRHGVRVEVHSRTQARVCCDRSKLSQVLVNLLTNAKESLTGGAEPDPCVRITTGEEENGMSWVEISDNGPGIAPENVERLFSKGFSTKPEGHGIGLHYCWLAVREMNGTLNYVEQDRSRGTTFRIELPRHEGTERMAA